jgi:hypothetical protein
VQFTIHRDTISNRSSLRPLLEAHFKYERMSAAKSRYLHLLAIVGVGVWVGAMWPSLLPVQMEEFILVLWAALLLIVVWASVETWACGRKMTRYLGEHKAKQRGLVR